MQKNYNLDNELEELEITEEHFKKASWIPIKKGRKAIGKRESHTARRSNQDPYYARERKRFRLSDFSKSYAPRKSRGNRRKKEKSWIRFF